MKISLRKAMAVQSALADQIAAVRITPVVEISIFEADRPAAIAAEKAKLQAALESRDRMVDLLYRIRGKVATANEASGVTGKLNLAARAEKQIQALSLVAGAPARQAEEITASRIARMLKRDDSGGDRSYARQAAPDIIEISLYDEAEVAQNARNLREARLARQRIQDDIAEINARETIDLDEADLRILQDLALI